MSGYYHRPLAGIGGWLTFFLIVIGVFTPLRIIIDTIGFFGDPSIAAFFGDRWGAVALWQGLLSTLQLGGFAFLAWRMVYVQVWQSVRITVAGLWILQVGLTALDFVATTTLGGLSAGQFAEAVGIAPFQAVVFAVIWTAYLLRSERVANTYLKTDDPRETAEVFS